MRRIRKMDTTTGAKAGAALLAAALAFAACDDATSGPGGDEVGTVEALVTDDPQSPSPSIEGAFAGPSLSVAAGSEFSGSLRGDFKAMISTDGETWIDLGSVNGVDLDLQSGALASLSGRQSVRAGTYSHVRLVIEGGEADLATGGVIGTITLGTDTAVSIGTDGVVVIDLTVPPFVIGSQTDARLVFDVNSEAWLTEPVVALGTVTESEITARVGAGVIIAPN